MPVAPATGKGQIQLIMGPMFSGKTTELLRRIRRYTVAKRRCLVIKYEGDKRYSVDEAATHDNHTHAAISVRELKHVTDLSDVDVVGVDEGQFYPDLVEFCELWANAGKIVVIAALDGTFQRKPFGQVLDLIPLAESVSKLNAVCMVCQHSASFTARLGKETQVEIIGGTDRYISACRSCHRLPNLAEVLASVSPVKPVNLSRKRVSASSSASARRLQMDEAATPSPAKKQRRNPKIHDTPESSSSEADASPQRLVLGTPDQHASPAHHADVVMADAM